ncbi:MAG: hypothetical protein PSV35_04225 [bacterium]|nr:hypothetical protein [bacterium]
MVVTKDFKSVDNSADGNCMYYAYSISLMYFLRAKADKKATDSVFSKLNLDEKQKAQLNSLLDENKPFNTHQIKTIIEPILGTATRRLGAEQTKNEFLQKPKDSPVFASTNYGMLSAFKKLLSSNNRTLASLIDNDGQNTEFTSAEIYQVPGMGKSIQQFARKQQDDLINEFDTRWKTKSDTITDRRESNLIFYKNQILENIISEKTVDFFKDNDNEQLNNYAKHLNKNLTWGTEETLMTLNRAITGERMVRDSKGKAEIICDLNIQLNVFTNGKPAIAVQGTPDIILDNRNNEHWLSLISPQSYKIVAAQNAPVNHDIPGYKKISISRDQANQLLRDSGFDKELEQLYEKRQSLIIDIGSDAPKVEDLSKLERNLRGLRSDFISGNKDIVVFSKGCNDLINESKKNPVLDDHRSFGIRDILAAIVNAVNSIFKSTPWKPVTESTKRVNALQDSLKNGIETTNTYKKQMAAMKSDSIVPNIDPSLVSVNAVRLVK